MVKILIIPFIMKSFTDFKDFHKLNFVKTSQLSEICGTGINTPYCTKMRKLKLCAFKQLSQHRIDKRWCYWNSDLGYWLQIHNFFHNSLHQTECVSKYVTVSSSSFRPHFSSSAYCPSPFAPLYCPPSLPSVQPSPPLSLFLLFITSYTHRRDSF